MKIGLIDCGVDIAEEQVHWSQTVQRRHLKVQRTRGGTGPGRANITAEFNKTIKSLA